MMSLLKMVIRQCRQLSTLQAVYFTEMNYSRTYSADMNFLNAKGT